MLPIPEYRLMADRSIRLRCYSSPRAPLFRDFLSSRYSLNSTLRATFAGKVVDAVRSSRSWLPGVWSTGDRSKVAWSMIRGVCKDWIETKTHLREAARPLLNVKRKLRKVTIGGAM